MEQNEASPARMQRRGVIAGLSLGVGALFLGRRADVALAGADGDWTTHGNAISGTRFLGTTNNKPLVIKTHNVTRMLVTRSGRVGIGRQPGAKLDVANTNVGTSAIRGASPNDTGAAPNAVGVNGIGTTGVKGTGATFGVLGVTTVGTAVKGQSTDDGGAVKAVFGECLGMNGNGVVGQASNGTSAYGVWGISTDGYAGVFSGKALVTGTLAKGGGSFKIDHPLDPANKYLYHSFVESPDMMNVYNGNVVTDSRGEAVITLPAYFGALNRDFRYQLTVVGQFAQAIVAKKIAGNRFSIKTDKPDVEVSWQVTGIRQDAFANANRIPVEEEKPAAERGLYLHPEELGKSASRGVQFARERAVVQS
jgi:hypothetical protein